MGANEQGTRHVEGRWLTNNRTLCFLRYENDVLLLKRAAHKRIFPNRYNGVGGHLERGEDPLTGARREILEETGLIVPHLTLRAIYAIDAGDDVGVLVFVFIGEAPQRAFVDTDEGTLAWTPVEKISELDLVDDLPLVLPRILAMTGSAPPLFIQMRYNHADQLTLAFVE